jgi:hypothetical protein
MDSDVKGGSTSGGGSKRSGEDADSGSGTSNR